MLITNRDSLMSLDVSFIHKSHIHCLVYSYRYSYRYFSSRSFISYQTNVPFTAAISMYSVPSSLDNCASPPPPPLPISWREGERVGVGTEGPRAQGGCSLGRDFVTGSYHQANQYHPTTPTPPTPTVRLTIHPIYLTLQTHARAALFNSSDLTS